MYTYIYIYMYVCMYTYIYIYTHARQSTPDSGLGFKVGVVKAFLSGSIFARRRATSSTATRCESPTSSSSSTTLGTNTAHTPF